MSARTVFPPCPPTVAERVDFIRQRLESGAWVARHDPSRLAEAWGLSRDQIANYRKSAGQLAVVDTGERPESIAECVKHIADLMAKCEWHTSRLVGIKRNVQALPGGGLTTTVDRTLSHASGIFQLGAEYSA